MIISQLITKREVENPESIDIRIRSGANEMNLSSPEKSTNTKPKQMQISILTVLKNTADCKVFVRFPSFFPQNPFIAPDKSAKDENKYPIVYLKLLYFFKIISFYIDRINGFFDKNIVFFDKTWYT